MRIRETGHKHKNATTAQGATATLAAVLESTGVRTQRASQPTNGWSGQVAPHSGTTTGERTVNQRQCWNTETPQL